MFHKDRGMHLRCKFRGYSKLSFVIAKIGILDAKVRSYFLYFYDEEMGNFFQKSESIKEILFGMIIRAYQIKV